MLISLHCYNRKKKTSGYTNGRHKQTKCCKTGSMPRIVISREPIGNEDNGQHLIKLYTVHGRCADSLYERWKTALPECDCGAPRQTTQHIHNDILFPSIHGKLVWLYGGNCISFGMDKLTNYLLLFYTKLWWIDWRTILLK